MRPRRRRRRCSGDWTGRRAGTTTMAATRSGVRTATSSTERGEIPKFLILKCGDAHSFSCDDPLEPCGGARAGRAKRGVPAPEHLPQVEHPLSSTGAGPNSLGTQNQKQHPQNSVTKGQYPLRHRNAAVHPRAHVSSPPSSPPPPNARPRPDVPQLTPVVVTHAAPSRPPRPSRLRLRHRGPTYS